MSTPPRPPLTGRLRLGHWVALDALAAPFVGLLVGVGRFDQPLQFGLSPRAAALLVATLVVLMAVRRLAPVPVFAAVLALAAAGTLVGATRIGYLAVAVAIYPVATSAGRRTAALALAATLVVIAGTVVAAPNLGHGEAVVGMVVTGTLVILAAWTVGVAVRSQRGYGAGLREAAARRAVTEERLRIARELHDVVAHGMSVIAVQAGVANYVVDSRPDEARRVLRSIEATSRSGLRELRQLLSVLRADGEAPALGPTPGLSDLDGLVARTREAGVPVTLEVGGQPRPLPPGVELAAYRIVQEALTNVVKHAGPARGEVRLRYEPDALTIEVTDDGRGDSVLAGSRDEPATARHGIVGMRERVALYQGELTAGPCPGGGFRVYARLPVGEAGAA